MTTAEWLACTGIGTGAGVIVLGLLKALLDSDSHQGAESHLPPCEPPPALPARAPQLRARHAAPPLVDETQPIRCVQPHRARHAREAA
ncbi:hypothetical protein [Streptomyces sp. NPDC046909]|uniref:hypothetical protein n=1 Tax=Streptomyces sp. NPDC046909 TaxID=3155617 RepID=UPI0033CC9A17